MTTQSKQRSIPLCAECGRQHATNSHPICTSCCSEFTAGLHRRRDAERRIQPLSDFYGMDPQ